MQLHHYVSCVVSNLWNGITCVASVYFVMLWTLSLFKWWFMIDGCLPCKIMLYSQELWENRRAQWSLRALSLEQEESVSYALKKKQPRELSSSLSRYLNEAVHPEAQIFWQSSVDFGKHIKSLCYHLISQKSKWQVTLGSTCGWSQALEVIGRVRVPKFNVLDVEEEIIRISFIYMNFKTP